MSDRSQNQETFDGFSNWFPLKKSWKVILSMGV